MNKFSLTAQTGQIGSNRKSIFKIYNDFRTSNDLMAKLTIQVAKHHFLYYSQLSKILTYLKLPITVVKFHFRVNKKLKFTVGRPDSFHARKNANFYISVVIHEGLHLSEHPLYYMYIRIRSRFKIQIGHAK